MLFKGLESPNLYDLCYTVLPYSSPTYRSGLTWSSFHPCWWLRMDRHLFMMVSVLHYMWWSHVSHYLEPVTYHAMSIWIDSERFVKWPYRVMSNNIVSNHVWQPMYQALLLLLCVVFILGMSYCTSYGGIKMPNSAIFLYSTNYMYNYTVWVIHYGCGDKWANTVAAYACLYKIQHPLWLYFLCSYIVSDILS